MTKQLTLKNFAILSDFVEILREDTKKARGYRKNVFDYRIYN